MPARTATKRAIRRTRQTARAPRRALCAAVVAILAAGAGIAPAPEDSVAFPVIPASTTFPDTVDGIPINEAPPRVTISVDPELFAGSDPALAGAPANAPSDGRDPQPNGTDQWPDDPDPGQVRTRALGAEGPSISTDRLSASDRELLEATGAIEASSEDRHDPPTHEPPLARPPEPPGWTTSTGRAAQADLEAYLEEQTGLEVQTRYIVGNRFAIVGAEVEDLQDLEGLTDVAPDSLVMPMSIPEDPYFPYQWSLVNTGQVLTGVPGNASGTAGADMNWGPTRGLDGSGVVVAVVDSPFDLSHRDLATSWYENPHETCGGTQDADENGYPGDCRGWSFYREAAGLDDPWDVHDPTTAAEHGTHVAGIIAAARDGTGTVGVAPGVTIMPLTVFLDGSTAAPLSRVAEAIRYAVDNGADVVNLSLGSDPANNLGRSEALEDALRHARDGDVLVVASAGNSTADIDQTPVYPASLSPDYDNLLTVGALDHQGQVASFSNFGTVSVDVAAPGHFVLAPHPVYGSAYMSGTSMAAPNAAGVAAMVLAAEPNLSAADVVVRLRDTAESDPAWQGLSVSEGRVSALGALQGHDLTQDLPSVLFSDLGPYRAENEGRRSVDTALLLAHNDGRVLLSVAMLHDDDLYLVMDHGLRAGPAGESSQPLDVRDDGAVVLPAHRALDLSAQLPVGDYAWVLEFPNGPVTGARFQVTSGGPLAPPGTPQPPPDAQPDPDPAPDPDPDPDPEEDPDPPPEPTPPDQDPNDPTGDDRDADPAPPGDEDTPEATPDPPPTDEQPEPPPPSDPPQTPAPSDPAPPGDDAPSEGPDDAPVHEEPEHLPPPVEPPTVPGGPPPTDPGDAPSPPPDNDEDDPQVPDDPRPDDDDLDQDGVGATSDVTPSSGIAGDTVLVTGSWPQNARVLFADRTAMTNLSLDTGLQVIVPGYAPGGTVDVTVTTVSGSQVLAEFPRAFTYTHSTSPDDGPANDPDPSPPPEDPVAPPPGCSGPSPPPPDCSGPLPPPPPPDNPDNDPTPTPPPPDNPDNDPTPTPPDQPEWPPHSNTRVGDLEEVTSGVAALLIRPVTNDHPAFHARDANWWQVTCRRNCPVTLAPG